MKLRLKALQCAVVVMTAFALAQPTAAQRGPTWPSVPIPAGAVRNLILDNCVSCHGIDDYAFYALDRASWQELLDTKHQGMNLEISGQGEALLVDYLATSFGPESIPFPRDYIPPEITEFFENDADARIFLETRCISCHGLDLVFETRYTPEGWRAVIIGERERGARLDDEELERLTEWLGRVRGMNPFE